MAGPVRADTRQFQALGRALREVGDKELKRQLYRAVSRATKPAKAEIKKSAISVLPHGGGLNKWAATLTVTTRQYYQGKGAGVLIKGGKNSKTKTIKPGFIGPLQPGQKRTRKTRRKGTFGAKADMDALNRGRVMHPTWGRGPLRGPQMVPKGFFDKPLQGPVSDRMRKEILAALDEITAEIARRTK